ncbi:MAG: S9 family peptidase [Bacteroidota bacterium]|nr:MAG: S9 family peptidase [Bacteroidota bacterium]
MNAPLATKISKELTLHGHTRTDHYFWMNQRGKPEVEAYLNAENEYTKKQLSSTEELQDLLFNEMKGRMKQTDMSVPFKENGYHYITRLEEGREYPIYCRRKDSPESVEEVLLNVNEMADGYAYYQLGGFSISPDNMILAYSVDTVGNRVYTLYFKDLKTGQLIDRPTDHVAGRATWANDSKTVFYTLKDEQTLRSHQIWRYQLGSNQPSVLIYQEDDETFGCYITKTRSKKYLMIGSSATLSDEYRVLKADNPLGEFRLFQPRIRGLEYNLGHYQDRFLIRTNHEAQNFRLMETPETNTGLSNWKELIPHREAVLLEGFMVFDRFLVLEERVKGVSQIRIINRLEGSDHTIDFGEDIYTAWMSVNPEYDAEVIRLGYSSLTTPTTTFAYHVHERRLEVLKQQEIVGGYDSSAYESRRIYVVAADGAEVPVSLVFKKGTPLDGSAPLLLNGYGSYGISAEAFFSSNRLSLLDRGFICGIAHIRGGQELGRHWYDDGKLLKKWNTFTDYIACCKYLINNRYTSADRLFAMGGSAGGMLVAVVANMEPELFKGIVAAVPFVDVVTTMLDEELPLTTGEYDEWGNPNEEEYYRYMLSYSPYDNVKAQEYPNILVTSGYHDSQVQYWEPAKWVAKLREIKKDNNLLLLHMKMDTGHGGASGRFEYLRETALEYAFMLYLMGIQE